MNLDVIIFGLSDLDLNWWFTFGLLRNFRFSSGIAGYCNFRLSFRTASYCTVRLQINSRLQQPARWEPFVAATMLRRREPTKENRQSSA